MENNDIILNRLIELVIDYCEGGNKYHWNKNENGPTKYGIYGPANNLSPKQVESLTLDKAISIYKDKYVTKDVIEAIKKNDFVLASILFNINVNLGPAQKSVIVQTANKTKETLSVTLMRFYKSLKNADLYYYGWSIRAIKNIEIGLTLSKEFPADMA